MNRFLKKRLLWVVIAVVLIGGAVIFIRPRQPFAGAGELTVERVTAYGQDVTIEAEEELTALLTEIQVSRQMDGAENWEETSGIVITGRCGGEDYTLTLGDYNGLTLGEEHYRIRGGGDLMVQVLELLPGGE